MTHWAREFFEAAALILEFLGVFVIFLWCIFMNFPFCIEFDSEKT